MNFKCKGRVEKIEIKHKDGTSTVCDGFDNLITNAGLDGLAVNSTTNLTRYCRVSSNSDIPLVTDNTIVNLVGDASISVTDTNGDSGGVPDWRYFYERTFTFPLGGVVGNISKIYILSSDSTSSYTLFSSVLTKDSLGNPTSIPVTSDDQLFITWKFEKVLDITPITGVMSFDFSGIPTDVNYEIKYANLGAYSNLVMGSVGYMASSLLYCMFGETNVLASVTSKPSGSMGSVTGEVSSYVPGSFEKTITYNLPTNIANYPSGIGCCMPASSNTNTGYSSFQVSFNPKLPKAADKTLSISFKVSWGRL